MRQPIKFGKYLLLERIAVGGMAEVFVAKAFGVEGFERLLAIKKILPTMGEDAEFISMFVDEARIAVQLSHANIVQVLELGKHDESLYIAMEYISGRDVRQLLERFRKRQQPVPIPQAALIVAEVCEALDYAHRKRDARGQALGIVHRDVSPQNVLVSFEGEVKLIDFGIAKAESRLQKTQAGILKGKFGYMSPEQVKGHAVDGRSDVFAAGILLWELVCGEKLFTGDSDFAILEKVRNGLVPAPRSARRTCPETLEKVILKALSTDPRERYQTASVLHDDLVPFTMVGDLLYGSRQLAGWMREEFRAEWEKELARLRTWLGVEDEKSEVTPVDPAYRRQNLPQVMIAAGDLAVTPRDPFPGPSFLHAQSEQSNEPTQQWRIAADKDTLAVPGDIAREVPTLKLDGQPTRPLAQVRKGGKKRSRQRMLFAVGVPLLLALAGGLRLMLADEVEERRPGLAAASAAPSAGLGYLTAATEPAARLTIDGRDTGRWTPVPPANPIALPAGAHTIVFETADGKRLEEQLQIEAGKTSRLVRSLP
jgi:serine/threonine protein kinase